MIGADTTLLSNYFGHMFSAMKFSIGGRTIENINDPGVLMDVMYLLKSRAIRNGQGEINHFIPDQGIGAAVSGPTTAAILNVA